MRPYEIDLATARKNHGVLCDLRVLGPSEQNEYLGALLEIALENEMWQFAEEIKIIAFGVKKAQWLGQECGLIPIGDGSRPKKYVL